MQELRDSQVWGASQIVERVNKFGLAYLAAEVRTGKTITSMQAMQDLGKKHVLFVTKKKAISSIQKDYMDMEFDFKITIINYESLHTIHSATIDAVICDESHCMGAFPKPSNRAVNLKKLIGDKATIFLSGTPNPETYSQLFHQFNIHEKSPWVKYKNFYQWVGAGYVFKYQKLINGLNLNFYDRGNASKIMADVEPYMVKLSQEEAGFDCPVTEIFHRIDMEKSTYKLIEDLKTDKVVTFSNGNDVVIDTPAKAMMKFRQLYSGTIKYEDGSTDVLDTTKIEYIKKTFTGKKIAIYYCFIEEGKLIRESFKNFTDDPMEFNKRNDLVFVCQMVSGREGINLSSADALVMYNIDFSATTYFQVRARLQDKNRLTPAIVNWVFANDGIEDKIYKAVSKKKNYTTSYFIKEFGIKF